MNFIDIHCHPSLKIWLFNRHIYHLKRPHDLTFSENMFVNLSGMLEGGVNAAVAAHYLPEAELRTDAMAHLLSDIAYLAIRALCGKKLNDLIEDKSAPEKPFEQINHYMGKFEAEIALSRTKNYKVEIAKSLAGFNDLISKGNIVFLHSIEGLHCLGTKQITIDQAKDHLNKLYDRGVCQITLAHFFENVVVSSQGGIPPNIKNFIKYDPGRTYPKGYNGQFAIDIVDEILNKGMIIDLVHCTRDAIEMIYARNDLRGVTRRPLVFSHTGVQEIASKAPSKIAAWDLIAMPDRSDILKIRESGGVIGIIFMDYWLFGKEATIPAIDVIIETIEFIKEVCGDYDNIAIGSDLDGFTEVPADLAGEHRMKDLVTQLLGKKIPMADVEKICYKNYLRVLQTGWGKQN